MLWGIEREKSCEALSALPRWINRHFQPLLFLKSGLGAGDFVPREQSNLGVVGVTTPCILNNGKKCGKAKGVFYCCSDNSHKHFLRRLESLVNRKAHRAEVGQFPSFC